MIEFYFGDKQRLSKIKKPKKGAWICATEPTEDELTALKKLIPFSEDVLASIKDPDEIPLLERYDQFWFFIVRAPKKHPTEHELQHSTTPIGVLVSKDYFMTVNIAPTDAIERLKQTPFQTSGIRAVLLLQLAIAKTFLRHLKKIGIRLHATQATLEKGTENKQIIELLELEKSLVYFSISLKANQLLTEKIARSKEINKKEENRELVNDIHIETQQAIATNKIYGVVVAEMMSAFSSIISNNLNKVIKTLTVITIILMLPTLVSSVYGMNISLPLQSHPHAFIIITIASLFLAVSGVLVFWKRKVF